MGNLTRHSRGLCLCALTSFLILICSTASAEPENHEGFPPFLNYLVEKYLHTVNPGEREALKDLHQRLRDAEKERDSAKDDAQKARGAEKISELSGELLDWLKVSPQPVDIDIETGKAIPPVSGPHPLTGYNEALILKVRTGEGADGFMVSNIDLVGTPTTLKLDIANEGTTWLLLILKNLPVSQSTFTLAFRREGQKNVQHLLTVETPMSGRLNLKILSDDSGQPAPAMVRITSKRDSKDVQPANAIELGPQFDGQARVSGHRNAYLPGEFGGEWWIVPGPFDMALAPGDYDIAIRRGPEHVPIFETFSIAAGKTTEENYRPRRWVDMRLDGWYSGDDHVHSRIQSDDDAERLMAWIQAEDVHVANIVKMGDIFRTWFEQRGFGEDFRYIDKDYVLSPGQEGPRTHQLGHTLAMATTSMVRDTDKYFLYDWVADTVHAQGGLWGFAHVVGGKWNNGGAFNVQAGMTLIVPHAKADFFEVMQFGAFKPQLFYEFLNMGFKMTASTGSDVPWGGTVGEARVYANIGDDPFSADAWFEAVRKGRTFVTNGPMLDLKVNDALPGDVLHVKRGDSIHVSARVRGHGIRSNPVRLELIKWGDVIHSATPAGESGDEIRADLDLPVDNGYWIALCGYAENGAFAHTTPVYVQVGDLRWWDIEKVDDLLDQRIASLAEVEHDFAAAGEKTANGNIPADQNQKEMGLQSKAMIERIQRTRNLLQELKQTAEKERESRS